MTITPVTAAMLLRPERDVLWNHYLAQDGHLVLSEGGAAAYASRALCLASSRHRVMLPSLLQPTVPAQLAHLAEAGLNVPELGNVIWSSDHAAAAHHGAGAGYDVFLLDDASAAIIGDPRWLEAVQVLNHKNRFIVRSTQRGLPVPQTHVFSAGEMPMGLAAGKWYVKAAVSASGRGVYDVTTLEDAIRAATKLGTDYQIQKDTPGIFLNVQYWIDDDGRPWFVGTSQQKLEGFHHMGNIFPTLLDPRGFTDPFAYDAAQLGARRLVAYDVSVFVDDDAIIVTVTPVEGKVIECNPRWNAASYATAVGLQLDIPSWTTHKITGRVNREHLKLGSLQYTPQQRCGVIVLGWSNQLLALMIAGTPDEQAEIITEANLHLAA